MLNVIEVTTAAGGACCDDVLWVLLHLLRLPFLAADKAADVSAVIAVDRAIVSQDC
jgi:hypothetical protein